MVQAVDTLIGEFAQDVRRVFPDARILLFGSYAEGKYDEGSDIDVAVFSQDIREDRILKAHRALFKIARRYYEYEMDIQPLAFPIRSLEENAFARQEIVKKGRPI